MYFCLVDEANTSDAVVDPAAFVTLPPCLLTLTDPSVLACGRSPKMNGATIIYILPEEKLYSFQYPEVFLHFL